MRDEKVMKSIKIIIALLMIFVCIPVSNISALESTDNSNIIIYTPTEEEFRAAEEIEIAKMKAYFERTKESYAYDYRKVGDPQTSSFSPYKNAYDQPAGGTIFNSENSGFYWSDSSRSPGTWSLGISIAGKYLSVDVAYSPGVVSGSSGGVFVGISSTQVGKAVKLKVARNYKVQRYDVYRKAQYGGSWTYLSSYGAATKYQSRFIIE